MPCADTASRPHDADQDEESDQIPPMIVEQSFRAIRREIDQAADPLDDRHLDQADRQAEPRIKHERPAQRSQCPGPERKGLARRRDVGIGRERIIETAGPGGEPG